jgi:indole-3-glycerol phosphate synthase
MNILDRLVQAAARRVARDKQILPPERLTALCRDLRRSEPMSPPGAGAPNIHRRASPPAARDSGVPAESLAFETALRAPGISFICEVKRASPSKGLIAADFPYADIARDYQAAGAACISVLTEPDYFLGSDDYLLEIAQIVTLPVLRKDFIIDPYQIYQAKLLGAKAVLLICAVLDPERLREYLSVADQLGLSALTEAHDGPELQTALAAGARIIGVNNRDLRTFQVDLSHSVRLRHMTPPEVLFVAESGISSHKDIQWLEQNGVDAVLVGEALMREPDRQAALRRLRGEIP